MTCFDYAVVMALVGIPALAYTLIHYDCELDWMVTSLVMSVATTHIAVGYCLFVWMLLWWSGMVGG